MKPKTRKIVLSIIAGLLALMLLLPFVLEGVFIVAGAASSVSELNEKLDELDAEKKKIKKQLNEIQAEKRDAAEEKAAIDRQINLTAREISTIDNLISELDVQANTYQKELEQAQEQEAATYDLFKKRIRAMEEHGTASYLSVLLSADSFSSFLSRAEIIGDVMNYDRGIMDDLKQQQAEITKKKEEIAKNKAAQESAKTKLAARKAELNEQTEEAAQVLDTLSGKESEYKKAYNAAESAQNAAKAEIKKILESQKRSSGSGKYVGGDMTWPVPGKYTITSPYGTRMDPIFKTYKKHTGIDIAAGTGRPIVAANSGTVIVAGWSSRGYGNYVVIDHGGGRSTLYAHQSRLAVSKGQKVSKGETIGYVGSTGYSTGPHLHFEVLINGNDTNPMNYFQKG